MNSDFLPRRGPAARDTSTPPPEFKPYSPQSAEAPHSDPQLPEPKIPDPSSEPPKKKWSFKTFKAWVQGLSKKKKIIYSIIIAIFILGGSAGAYVLTRQKPAPKPAIVKKQVVKKEPPKPTVVPSTLSGLPVKPEVNDRQVIGVMIENSPDARPQSGLNQASVIFEAIAEGGITRFLTLWQDTDSDYIGPVRSVRPYYIQWAVGFDAAIAHVGGSGEALANMKEWKVKDLDQFAGGAYFWRIPQRYAPHNMYTSLPKLYEYATKKDYTKSTYTGLARKAAEQKAATPTAKSIDMTLSGYYYNVHYDYDPATNSYLRSEGGKPHTDERSAKQLSPKVVVALAIPYSIGSDGLHSVYQTIGSGQAFIFQDGLVTPVTWHKESRTAQFSFTDANGKAVTLNPGQTWLTAVSAANQVTYVP